MFNKLLLLSLCAVGSATAMEEDQPASTRADRLMAKGKEKSEDECRELDYAEAFGVESFTIGGPLSPDRWLGGWANERERNNIKRLKLCAFLCANANQGLLEGIDMTEAQAMLSQFAKRPDWYGRVYVKKDDKHEASSSDSRSSTPAAQDGEAETDSGAAVSGTVVPAEHHKQAYLNG